MIEFCNVKLGYVKEYFALYNLNLHIEDKKVLGIVGGKDDGKTSLLRLLTKLEKPTSGQILYNGVPLENIDYSKDLSVAYLATKPILLNGSVRKNIDYVLKIRKIKSDERQNIIDETIEKFGLKAVLDKKVKTLTLFQKRLLQFAMLSVRPKIDLLLVDDILLNLENEEKKKIKEIMQSFMQNSTTVYATQDIDSAKELCQTIAHIKLGAISEIENI